MWCLQQSEPSPLWPPDVCIVRQNTSPAAVQPLAGLALTYVEGPWAYPGGASEPAGVAWYPQSDRDKSAPSPRDAASGVRGTQETPYHEGLCDSVRESSGWGAGAGGGARA